MVALPGMERTNGNELTTCFIYKSVGLPRWLPPRSLPVTSRFANSRLFRLLSFFVWFDGVCGVVNALHCGVLKEFIASRRLGRA